MGPTLNLKLKLAEKITSIDGIADRKNGKKLVEFTTQYIFPAITPSEVKNYLYTGRKDQAIFRPLPQRGQRLRAGSLPAFTGTPCSQGDPEGPPRQGRIGEAGRKVKLWNGRTRHFIPSGIRFTHASNT